MRILQLNPLQSSTDIAGSSLPLFQYPLDDMQPRDAVLVSWGFYDLDSCHARTPLRGMQPSLWHVVNKSLLRRWRR